MKISHLSISLHYTYSLLTFHVQRYVLLNYRETKKLQLSPRT